jgi:hypothetical protein
VQSRRSRLSAKAAPPLLRSSLLTMTSRLPIVLSSTACPNASLLVAYHPRVIPGIPSRGERPPGQQPTAPMILPSKGLDAGAATVSDDMLISLRPIGLQPQPRLSTRTQTNLLTSPIPPGAIFDLNYPSPLGLPLVPLQPQLATVSPCGTLLAL